MPFRDAASSPRLVIAVVSLALAVWLGSLDQSIASTLLPAIAADLQVTPAESVIVIHAYQMAVVTTLLPFAALGDRWGARRVFLTGVAIFNLAALGSAWSTDLYTLAFFRALQGIGASGVMSVNLALVRRIFPADQLGRGTGLNAFVVGMGYSLGPTLASALLQVVSWPWLFGLQFPIGLLGWLLAHKHLPATPPVESATPYARGLAVLSALCFAALIFALGAVAQQQSLWVVFGAVLVMLASGGLVLHGQKDHAAPMLPVDLMRRPMFRLSVFTSFCSFTTQGLAFVSLPFFLQQQLHRPVLETGLLMTAWSIVVALSAPLAGPLSDRRPPAILGGVGLSMLSVGMGLLSVRSSDDSLTTMALCIALCGFGFGLFQSPNLRAIMSSAPAHRVSGASGMVAMARLVGQASGAALVALCFHVSGPNGPGNALALGALTAGIGALLSLARLRAQ
jgi:DHA2 family multidrug resistance protein-like MFS transporter